MKSLLLATTFVAAILMQTSNARADWDFFKPTEEHKGYPFLPTVSLAAGIEGSGETDVYGNFLLGVSHYPIGGKWSPFYSVAAELDLRSLKDMHGNTSTIPVFGPQVRGGVSLFPEENLALSFFNAYGFVSYRAASAFEGHVIRFGAGVSSPGGGLLVLAARIPIPWMIEGAFDVTDDEVRPSFRFGFSY